MSSDDSNYPPTTNHLIIDNHLIVGLPPLKAPKKAGKGHHSWLTLELVTKEKHKKGSLKLVYSYPAL
jgi:hypothetical protein